MSTPSATNTDKAVCTIETLRIKCCEAVGSIPRPAHTELEKAVFTIEILSSLRVHLGNVMRIPSNVVRTKCQTPLKNYTESFVECTRPVPFRPRWRVSIQLKDQQSQRAVAEAERDIEELILLLGDVKVISSRVEFMQVVHNVAPGRLLVELLDLADATLQCMDANPDIRPITGGDRQLEECRLSAMDVVEVLKGSIALDKSSEEEGALFGWRSLEGEYGGRDGDLGTDCVRDGLKTVSTGHCM